MDITVTDIHLFDSGEGGIPLEYLVTLSLGSGSIFSVTVPGPRLEFDIEDRIEIEKIWVIGDIKSTNEIKPRFNCIEKEIHPNFNKPFLKSIIGELNEITNKKNIAINVGIKFGISRKNIAEQIESNNIKIGDYLEVTCIGFPTATIKRIS